MLKINGLKFHELNFTFNKNQFILCLKRYVYLWLVEKYANILVRGKSSCQVQIFLSGANLLVKGKSSCQVQIFLSRANLPVKGKSSCQNGENYFLILLLLKTFYLNETHVSFVIFSFEPIYLSESPSLVFTSFRFFFLGGGGKIRQTLLLIFPPKNSFLINLLRKYLLCPFIMLSATTNCFILEHMTLPLQRRKQQKQRKRKIFKIFDFYILKISSCFLSENRCKSL